MLSKMQLQLDKNKQIIRDLNTEIDVLKGKGQTDQNLITNKMKQITDLERKITNLEKELEDKDCKIITFYLFSGTQFKIRNNS